MPGRGQADVVLLGVLPHEPDTWRRRLDERRPDPPRLRRRLADLLLRTLEQTEQVVVVEVARCRDDDVPGHVRRAVVRGDRPPRDGRDHLSGADHGPAEGVAAEHRLGDQIVDELLRLVLVHRDLLEHDLALGVHLGESRSEDHVAHHVDRRLEVVVGDPRVDDGVLARGCGIQLAAEPVENLGDLLRRVAVCALEEQMLDEVRDARAVIALVARARADPVAERDRANVRQPLGDDPLARVKLGEDVLLHGGMVVRGRLAPPSPTFLS